MSIKRRLAYAGLGMLPVLVALYALYENYGTHSMYYRGREFLRGVIALDHEWTPIAFLMLTVGLYLLASAAQGARLLSRKWLVSAIAAVTLAWVLICGMAVLRGFILPEPAMPQCNMTWW